MQTDIDDLFDPYPRPPSSYLDRPLPEDPILAACAISSRIPFREISQHLHQILRLPAGSPPYSTQCVQAMEEVSLLIPICPQRNLLILILTLHALAFIEGFNAASFINLDPTE